MSSLPQQPRSISEILTASFELYKESFTRLIGYSVIIFACQTFLNVHTFNAIGEAISQIQTTTSTTMPQIDNSEAMRTTKIAQDTQAAMQQAIEEATSGLTGLQIAFALVTMVLYSAMIYRVDNVINKRDDDYAGLLLPSVKKLHLLIIAGIFYGIAVVIGTFLLVIPGLILAVSLPFFGFLILLEDQGIFESLMSSHRLVWGNWWRTNIVFFIPAFALAIVLGIVFSVMFSGMMPEGSTTPDLANLFGMMSKVFIGVGIINTFIAPYFVVLVYLQYHDLKLRNNL